MIKCIHRHFEASFFFWILIWSVNKWSLWSNKYTDLLYKKTWQEAHWRCMQSPVCCPLPPSVWTCLGGRTPWPSGDAWWAACTDPRLHNPHLFFLNLLREDNKFTLKYYVPYVFIQNADLSSKPKLQITCPEFMNFE